jgi:hypothetical protein
MSRPVKVILVLVTVVIVAWLVWTPIKAGYVNTTKRLDADIATLTGDVNRFTDAAQNHVALRRRIQSYVDRTLGGDLETVDHRLRTHLNRIGEELGLESLTVGTGRVRRLESPAKSQFRRRGQRAYRDEIDFVEVEGWIAGESSLENALRLVHHVEAEPWIKRIQQVRLQPKDNGTRFGVQVRLVTLFLPDRAPVAPPPPGNPEGFERYAPLAARNQFQVPAPAPQPAPAVAQTAPPSPLDQWVVTGVAAGRGLAEVWLLNSVTNESRTLAVGEAFLGLALVSANGGAAEFQAGDERFRIVIGSRLTDRQPAP